MYHVFTAVVQSSPGNSRDNKVLFSEFWNQSEVLFCKL